MLSTIIAISALNLFVWIFNGQAYKELLSIQRESYGDAEKGTDESVRKVVYCQLKSGNYDGAFENLEALEDIYSEDPKKYSRGMKETRRLLGQVNYEIFKYPSLAETAHRTFGCGAFSGDILEISEYWYPRKPVNGSKMSGHRITYA
jgi:hypothetical protein